MSVLSSIIPESITTANKASPIPLFTQICFLDAKDHFFKLIPNHNQNMCIGIQIEFTIKNLVRISRLYEAIPKDRTTNK
jgi:hypothetical protein